MRCTSCGLPLSPARTMRSCPRCDAPIIAEKRPAAPAAHLPFRQTAAQAQVSVRTGVPWKAVAPKVDAIDPRLGDRFPTEVVRGEMIHAGERDESVSGGEVSYGFDAFEPASADVHAPAPFPPAGPTTPTSPPYMPPPMSTPMQAPELDRMWLPTPNPAAIGEGQRGQHARHEEAKLGRWEGKGGQARGKNYLGFIAAGICVMMGGLILVFVYFMAAGLPGDPSANDAGNTNTVTSAPPTTAPSHVSSPTATPFPGQKYVDHAQLAGGIDPVSHRPIQLTTTFKMKQAIYVFFQIHSAGQYGAVCLLWYANNRVFFPYALPVYPNEQTSYSFVSYDGTGSGYVELYWASTTSCTDKVLAQRVNFTVTA